MSSARPGTSLSYHALQLSITRPPTENWPGGQGAQWLVGAWTPWPAGHAQGRLFGRGRVTEPREKRYTLVSSCTWPAYGSFHCHIDFALLTRTPVGTPRRNSRTRTSRLRARRGRKEARLVFSAPFHRLDRSMPHNNAARPLSWYISFLNLKNDIRESSLQPSCPNLTFCVHFQTNWPDTEM